MPESIGKAQDWSRKDLEAVSQPWLHVVVGWQEADGTNLQNQPWRLLLKGYWTNKLISFILCFVDLLNVDIDKFEIIW